MLLSLIALLFVIIYPFVKRISYFPQIILGFAFGWSIPMGYSATVGIMPLECWLLVIINVIWTVIYDTIYAMIDKNDDIKIGVRSTAVLFGKFDIFIIGILQFIMLMLLIFLGKIIFLSKVYYLSIIITMILFIYQQKLIIQRIPELYLKAFNTNVYIGFFIFLGIFCNYW